MPSGAPQLSGTQGGREHASGVVLCRGDDGAVPNLASHDENATHAHRRVRPNDRNHKHQYQMPRQLAVFPATFIGATATASSVPYSTAVMLLAALTCTNKIPLAPEIFRCEPINVAVNVPTPTTDWPAIMTAALIGVLGALLGSAVGAWIAITHSRSVRREDNLRHIKERSAELLSHLSAAHRIISDYYDDGGTGRNAVPNGIKVRAMPDTHHKGAKDSLAAASAVLEYLSLVGPTDLSDAAKRAASSTRELFEFVIGSDFLEVDYKKYETKFQTRKSDLVLLVSPER